MVRKSSRGLRKEQDKGNRDGVGLTTLYACTESPNNKTG